LNVQVKPVCVTRSTCNPVPTVTDPGVEVAAVGDPPQDAARQSATPSPTIQAVRMT
jgi:hypothetical protein